MFALTFFFTIVVCLAAGKAEDDDLMLAWDVSASFKDKGILKRAIGLARKGTLHAIMGPSGSGKSTVINALSNTIPQGSIQLSGMVQSAETVSPIYVAQDDLLFAQLTSEETLETSGMLKSNTKVPQKSKLKDAALQSLNTLGLKKVRGTKVGDAKTRGLSGGEKKRLSIGNELIGDAATGGSEQTVIIYADEPTSGLDSFQAQNVMKLLRELANEGNTVITAIHQPRASILEMFDTITLLSEGEVCYSGPAGDKMTSFFATVGYPCPAKGVNPAEFLLDLISIDYSSPNSEKESRERVTTIQQAFSKSSYADDIFASIDKLKNKPPSQRQIKGHGEALNRCTSFGDRLRLGTMKARTLLKRAWRTILRDKSLNIARFASSTFSALLFGAIYYKLGKGAGTVPDRLGLLQVAAVNTAMTSLIKATTSFVTEKLIVNRERRGDNYSVLSYFLSKLVAEAPLSAFFPTFAGVVMYKLCGLNNSPGRLRKFVTILTVESFASSSLGMLVGSYASSVESAIAMAPAIMVIFIVFGGLYVVNTPKWLSWVPRVSLIRWAYEGLCVNELEGLELTPEARIGPKSATSGSQVLESLGMSGSSVRNALVAQASIIAFNYVATYISLLRQKPRFERIVPYDEEEGEDLSGKVKTLASSSFDVSQEEPASRRIGEEEKGNEEDEEDEEEVGVAASSATGGSTMGASSGMRRKRRRHSRTSPPSVIMKPNAPPTL